MKCVGVLVTRHFQEYVEPGDEMSQSWRSTGPASRTSGVDEKVLLPLGEDTLTHNLGVPIIVVITKVCTNGKETENLHLVVSCIVQYSPVQVFYISIKDVLISLFDLEIDQI